MHLSYGRRLTALTERTTALDAPIRLGFAVTVIGRPGLKETDSRRWQNGPHLRVILAYLDAIFDYLGECQLRTYRISSGIRTAHLPELPEMVQVGHPAKCKQCGDFSLVPNIGLAALPMREVRQAAIKGEVARL